MAHILIVEDDTFIAKLLAVRLEHAGHSIVWARDGKQALMLVHAQSPHLILLDVMMPGMNGFEVARQLKLDRTTDYIPVVMLTARTEGQAVMAGIESGADVYLTKPIHFPDLLSRIERIVACSVGTRPTVNSSGAKHSGPGWRASN
jgi:DNA-binding response OmpR family regulator